MFLTLNCGTLSIKCYKTCLFGLALNKRNGVVKKIKIILIIIIIIIKMCDLSFKLLISNIHSDSFSIYMYVQSIHFCFDQIPWMALLWNWSLNVHISLWDLRTRRSNWAAQLGAWTQLLERHLLPTQILQKIVKQSFQPRKRDRRKGKQTNKNKEGHIVGTGVSAPSSPPGQVFLVRLACDGHRWAKLEGN